MILGRDAIITIRNKSTRQTQISILKSVCRIAHAAAMIAPHGPPLAVPAAISATALPLSTPAFTVAAAAFVVASAPFAAAFVAACFAACFAALAAWEAAWPTLSWPSPICCLGGSAIISPPMGLGIENGHDQDKLNHGRLFTFFVWEAFARCLHADRALRSERVSACIGRCQH